LIDLGGGGLIMIYKCSTVRLLAAVYPDYEWLPWKFARLSNDFWADEKNKRKFIEWAGKQLGIKHINDWNVVSTKDIRELGNVEKLELSLPQLLSSVYPEHNWLFDLKSKSPFYKKTQHMLKTCLKKMFPQEGKN
jgi:hypothetical protein